VASRATERKRNEHRVIAVAGPDGIVLVTTARELRRASERKLEAESMATPIYRDLSPRTATYRGIVAGVNEAINQYRRTLIDINESGRTPSWQQKARQEARQRVAEQVNTFNDKAGASLQKDYEAIAPPKPENMVERLWARMAGEQDVRHLADREQVLGYYRKTAATLGWEARAELDRVAVNRLRELGEPGAEDEVYRASIPFLSDPEVAVLNATRAANRHGQVIGTLFQQAKLDIDAAMEDTANGKIPTPHYKPLTLPEQFELHLHAGEQPK